MGLKSFVFLLGLVSSVISSRIRIAKQSDPIVKHMCMVSSNAPDGHAASKTNFQELFDSCVASAPEAHLVVLALQDYKNDIHPSAVLAVGRGGIFRKPFVLVEKVLLSDRVGHGKFCRKVGKLKSLGAALASCGGVAVLVYAAEDVQVEIVGSPQLRLGSATDTTQKGTVSLVLDFNDRRIVVASTHAEEGVRGKKKGSRCPSEHDKGIAAEESRVQDFRQGLDAIRSSLSEGDGVLWGGDFNPRTQSPSNGCPIWPKKLPVQSAQLHIPDPAQEHINAMLLPLMEGRDIIGASPGENGKVTSFKAELAQAGIPIEELPGVKCPTYKKMSKPAPQFDIEFDADSDDNLGQNTEYEQEAAQCIDPGEEEMMFYLPDKPMAWTDRIFASTSVATPWMVCSGVQRITHKSDHDAVLTACSISSELSL